MPRPKGSKNKNSERKVCIKCNKNKLLTDFYISNSPLFDGRSPVCKQCIEELVDENNMDTVYQMLQQLDIKFDPLYWERAKDSKGSTFRNYIRMANSLPQFNGTGWKDSEFKKQTGKTIESNNEDSKVINSNFDDFELTDEIISFWGSGYTKEQYKKLNKFKEDMEMSYEIETASHKDYLKKICIVSLKMEEALAENQIDDFKKLSDAYDKLMHSAKFTAVQRSPADRTGGMHTVSEIVEFVEKHGFIPKFHIDEPNDIVDKTEQNIMNYLRNLILGDPNIGSLVEQALQRLNEKDGDETNNEVYEEYYELEEDDEK